MASTTRVTAPAMSSSRLSVWASSVSGMATTSVEPSVSPSAATRYCGPSPREPTVNRDGSRSVPRWIVAGRSGGASTSPP